VDEDVLHAQVAVELAGQGLPGGPGGPHGVEEGKGVAAQGVVEPGGDDVAGVALLVDGGGAGWVEDPEDGVVEGLEGAVVLGQLGARGAGVDPGDVAADVVEGVGAEAPLLPAGLQGVRLVVAAHVHGPLDRLEGVVEGVTDGDHPQVDAVGPAAVEAQLLQAEVAAALEGAVVEEAEVHGLLDLVAVVAAQEDGGPMGVHHVVGMGFEAVEEVGVHGGSGASR
jgi:hypothetical protein